MQQNVVMKLDKSGNSGSPNIAPIINSKSKCNQPRVFLHVPLGCIVHPHKRSCFSSVCTTRSVLQDVSVIRHCLEHLAYDPELVYQES